jgi:acyl-CoA thioesterase
VIATQRYSFCGKPAVCTSRDFQSSAWWRRGIVVLLVGLAGCLTPKAPVLPELPLPPRRVELRVGDRYVFHSDVMLQAEHPVLQEVARLPQRVRHELHLPPSQTLVQVYLFADRGAYERYLHAHFRHLPPRRAIFMARPGPAGEELLVFAFWGDRILEDLRHELTHAELHSVCPNIPMWLDEGLAEFFEVPQEQDGVHYRHLAALRAELATPWSPSLERLEKLAWMRDLTPQDYREAWAWAHFFLRGPDSARRILLEYLQDLHKMCTATSSSAPSRPQDNPSPLALSARLRQVIPEPEKALSQHLAALERRFTRLDADEPESR